MQSVFLFLCLYKRLKHEIFFPFFEGHFCHPGSGSGSTGTIESRFFNPDSSYASNSDQYLKALKGLSLATPHFLLTLLICSPLNTMRPLPGATVVTNTVYTVVACGLPMVIGGSHMSSCLHNIWVWSRGENE
jgi:hypothetical protein